METPVYALGLAKIEIGEMSVSGGMGTELEQLGLTYEDSCQLKQDDPEKTEIKAEESDDPVIVINKAGSLKLNFSMMSYNPTVLKKLCGGTVSEDGKTWNAPSSFVTIEKSVRITAKQGVVIDIPRCSLIAKLNTEFKKTAVGLVEVTGTVLVPKDGTTSKLIVKVQD